MHDEIRDSVRSLCSRFPGEYWRSMEDERRYPTEFVQALGDSGYLALLIPEEFGGSGLGLQGFCSRSQISVVGRAVRRSGGFLRAMFQRVQLRSIGDVLNEELAELGILETEELFHLCLLGVILVVLRVSQLRDLEPVT